MSDLEKYKDLLNHGKHHEDDEMAEFLSALDKAEVPEGREKDRIWESIEEKIEEEDTKSRSLWPYMAIAAAVTLIALFYFIFLPSSVSYSTELAETKTIELPDGSMVTLNAGSELSHDKNWNRTVQLKGEGFFEVVKGSSFEVKTSRGLVTVLGTSFNVFDREEKFEVACKTGKVRVDINDNQFTTTLTPGKVVSMENDQIEEQTIPTKNMANWQSGEFFFENEKLYTVLKELERQYGIEIELLADSDIRFTGYFNNADVDSALEMICLPLELTYQKQSAAKFIVAPNE